MNNYENYPLFVYEETVSGEPQKSFRSNEKLCLERLCMIHCFHVIESSEKQIILTNKLHKVEYQNENKSVEGMRYYWPAWLFGVKEHYFLQQVLNHYGTASVSCMYLDGYARIYSSDTCNPETVFFGVGMYW
jgi:hypothetical protein